MNLGTNNEMSTPYISVSIKTRRANNSTVSKLNTTTHALKEHNAMEMALMRSKAQNLIRKRLRYKRGRSYGYEEPLTIDKIEEIVPPSILVLFLSSYLVQVPTSLQVIAAYSDRLWGKENFTTTRILCSLSVNFSSLPAKRAAVTKQLQRRLSKIITFC